VAESVVAGTKPDLPLGVKKGKTVGRGGLQTEKRHEQRNYFSKAPVLGKRMKKKEKVVGTRKKKKRKRKGSFTTKFVERKGTSWVKCKTRKSRSGDLVAERCRAWPGKSRSRLNWG